MSPAGSTIAKDDGQKAYTVKLKLIDENLITVRHTYALMAERYKLLVKLD
jgi:hypothetical protein